MKDITKIHIFENRIEVEPKIYYVGDKGVPHISLMFHYNFNSNLDGKTLILRYVFSDNKYIEETRVLQGSSIEFPIHFGCFKKGGWTNLYISIIDDRQNKITLDPIVIKTKAIQVGEQFNDPDIEVAINDYVVELKNRIEINLEEKAREYLEKAIDKKTKILEIEGTAHQGQELIITLPKKIYLYKKLEFKGYVVKENQNWGSFFETFNKTANLPDMTNIIQTFLSEIRSLQDIDNDKLSNFDEHMKKIQVSGYFQGDGQELNLNKGFFQQKPNSESAWKIVLFSLQGNTKYHIEIYGEERL